MGHGPLILGVKEGDYGEPHFYSGLSSSGKTDPAREESYQIAHSIGVGSEANLACGFNFCQIGILSGENFDAAKICQTVSQGSGGPRDGARPFTAR